MRNIRFLRFMDCFLFGESLAKRKGEFMAFRQQHVPSDKPRKSHAALVRQSLPQNKHALRRLNQGRRR